MVKARRVPLVGALIAAMILTCSSPRAESGEVRVAQQFGIAYLPLLVVKKYKLIEKHAQLAGLSAVTATWNTFSSGADMNTALLAGQLDFASGGIAPLLQMWDRTRDGLAVKGVAALGSLPLFLNTTNPKVRSIADLTENNKIALPAVKVSIQALVLQMAAAQVFGEANYNVLDRLTVSLSHPQGLAALLSRTEIDAHFTNSPFQEQELNDPGVRRLLSSYDVLGGPSTLNSVYATSKYRKDNPLVFAAMISALREAMEIIRNDKVAAAKLYIDEEKSKLDLNFVAGIVGGPLIDFTVAPRGFLKFGEFMAKTKSLKAGPSNWTEVFFPEIHGENGS